MSCVTLAFVVTLDPATTGTRSRWERIIWLVDLAAYLFCATAATAAAFDMPGYLLRAVQYEWIVWLWAGLLGLGGFVAFLGRLTRVWAAEWPANVAVGFGAFLYAVILVPSVAAGSNVAVLALVLIAWLAAARRYAELRIFASEPGLESFRDKLQAAKRRRTGNIVPRSDYR